MNRDVLCAVVCSLGLIALVFGLNHEVQVAGAVMFVNSALFFVKLQFDRLIATIKESRLGPKVS